MTSDYEHDLIGKMKEIYREGYYAQDEIYSTYNSEGSGWGERKRNAVKIAREKLEEALIGIPELMEEMKNAEDLPRDERDRYVQFMQQHLDNIHNWFEKLPGN